jgi:hypothetical protein
MDISNVLPTLAKKYFFKNLQCSKKLAYLKNKICLTMATDIYMVAD